jgi:hypothetical protein
MSGHQTDFLRMPSHAGDPVTALVSIQKRDLMLRFGIVTWSPVPGHTRAARQWDVPGWGFVDTYRTLCLAPTPEMKLVFDSLRDLPRVS